MRLHQAFAGIQSETGSRLLGGLEGLDGPGQLFGAETRSIVGNGNANGVFVFQEIGCDDDFGRTNTSIAFAGIDDDIFDNAVKCQLAAIELEFAGQFLTELAIDSDVGKAATNAVEDLLNRGRQGKRIHLLFFGFERMNEFSAFVEAGAQIEVMFFD